MDEHRDIYTKPTGKSEEPQALPAPEVAPAEIRARVRRRTIVSVSLMVALLGGAATYFFLQDPKTNPMLELLHGSTNRAERAALRVVSMTNFATPVAEDLAVSLSIDPRQAPPNLPPQKLAEVMALMRQANEFMMNREWDGAEANLRRTLAIWPEMNAAMRLLGALYLQRGQFDQAILTLEKAIKGDPFNADTFNNLAAAYMQRGQLERAEDLLLTALQIRPDSAVTHINLGLLYILWGRYDQSAEHLQAAVRQLPDNPSVRNNLGVSLLRLGRYEEARANFRHLISRQPNRPEAYFNTAITYVLERNHAEALAWLRQGVARCSPVEAQRNLMDSDFDSLRALPEFNALLRELTEPARDAPSPRPKS